MKDLSDDKAGFAESLEKKIKTDFETGNIVLVDGWVLSISEARQCALFSQSKTE